MWNSFNQERLTAKVAPWAGNPLFIILKIPTVEEYDKDFAVHTEILTSSRKIFDKYKCLTNYT